MVGPGTVPWPESRRWPCWQVWRGRGGRSPVPTGRSRPTSAAPFRTRFRPPARRHPREPGRRSGGRAQTIWPAASSCRAPTAPSWLSCSSPAAPLTASRNPASRERGPPPGRRRPRGSSPSTGRCHRARATTRPWRSTRPTAARCTTWPSPWCGQTETACSTPTRRTRSPAARLPDRRRRLPGRARRRPGGCGRTAEPVRRGQLRCVECVTYALATQLVLSLPDSLDPQSLAELEALWREIAAFGPRSRTCRSRSCRRG